MEFPIADPTIIEIPQHYAPLTNLAAMGHLYDKVRNGMTTLDLSTLIALRTAIGYLGEKEQFDWWHSAFFSPSSPTFLDPVFPKTRTVAQCSGVTRAAMLVHDERIGVGRVYHLFRLPEDQEQAIHRQLHDHATGSQISDLVQNQIQAMTYLESVAESSANGKVGPVRVGDVQAVRQLSSWQHVAGLYLIAFQANTSVYPYFTESTA